jgi:hypothetical protein
MPAITACDATCPVEGVDDTDHRAEQADEGGVVTDGGQERQPPFQARPFQGGGALHGLVGRLDPAIRQPQPGVGDPGRDRRARFQRPPRAGEVARAQLLVQGARQRFQVAAPAPQVDPALDGQRQAGD